jgi:hypothetical protein
MHEASCCQAFFGKGDQRSGTLKIGNDAFKPDEKGLASDLSGIVRVRDDGRADAYCLEEGSPTEIGLDELGK